MDNEKAKKDNKVLKYYWKTTILRFVITSLILFILFYFVVGVHVCHDNSQYPMIKDGDLVITYKLDHKLHQNDAVLFKDSNGKKRFGRVVAFENDKVQVFSDFIKINDSQLNEITPYSIDMDNVGIDIPYTVPGDTVFILNDYRSNLDDSRVFGGVNNSDIEGKIIFIMRRRDI